MSRMMIQGRFGLVSVRMLSKRGYTSKTLVRFGVLALVLVVGGCGTAGTVVPPPRPIVNHSGVRIRADHDRMIEVQEWVDRETTNIEQDPSFWVIGSTVLDEVFPWEDLHISNDSVTVQIPLSGREAELVYNIYAHLHMMVHQGRQEEWLPEAPAAVGYELERAILKRCADAWVLGRTVWDTQPFAPMDELMYASEGGFLEPFIFTARPGEFATSRAEWVRSNPDGMQEYRDWFIDTFNREPPGLRSN